MLYHGNIIEGEQNTQHLYLTINIADFSESCSKKIFYKSDISLYTSIVHASLNDYVFLNNITL